jgi:hypothetical protein
MDKEKLLEIIQDNIGRFSNQSFLIKGWAVTLLSALLVFSKGSPAIKYNLMFAFLVFAFWGLDSYYLLQERKFRTHFNNLLNGNIEKLDLELDYLTNSVKYFKCVFSKPSLIFYSSLLVFLLIFNFII